MLAEARELMAMSPENETEHSAKNLQAAELLQKFLSDSLSSALLSDRELSDLRMLLANAYFTAKAYEDATIILADVMSYHNDRFDEAEAKIDEIRMIRGRYNGLLSSFLLEIKKDPNDPDDPFDESVALGYITEMETLFSNADTSTTRQIATSKQRLKLAVDRIYRDQILQLAHELILEGEYLAAIDRYLRIEDIDLQGFYVDSFDLQKQEFLNLELPALFVTQVRELTLEMQELNRLFSEQSSTLAVPIQDFIETYTQIFLDDSLGSPVTNATADSGVAENDAVLLQLLMPQLDSLLPNLIEFTGLQSAIEQGAVQIMELRNQLPLFLPAEVEDRDSEYLFYLEQFIAGPQQFEQEGMAGAAKRQRAFWENQLKDTVLTTMRDYIARSDLAYESGAYEDLFAIQAPLNATAELLFTLFSFFSQGTYLDREDNIAYMQLIREEDKREATLALLEMERIQERVALAQFTLRHNRFTENTYSEKDPILAAYNVALDFIAEVENHSDEYQSRLTNMSSSVADINLPMADYLSQHIEDRDALIKNIRATAIGHLQQYIGLEQAVLQQLYVTTEADIGEGNREIAGIEVQLVIEGSNTSDIRYYPGQAAPRFLAAENNLSDIITEAKEIQNLITAGPAFLQNSEAVRAIDARLTQLLAGSQLQVDSAQVGIQLATASVEEAEQVLARVPLLRDGFNEARSRQDYAQANEFFSLVDAAYNESLNIDYSDSRRVEREAVLRQLSQDLLLLLTEVANIEKTKAFELLESALVERDYFAARDALADAKQWDERLSTPPDQTIIAFEATIEQAIILSGQRDIPPVNDSLYPRITNDLNEAGKSLARAKEASLANNVTLLREESARATSFINSVRAQLPANSEASFIELQLIQLEDPAAFDDYFVAEIETIEVLVFGNPAGSFGSGIYNEYSLLEKDQLLSTIEALNRLRRNSRLERIIIDIEVELGRRESPAIVAARNQANARIAQSRSLIASARREANPTRYEELLNAALNRLREAQTIFPRITGLSSLISEAEVLLGLEATLNLPFEVNQLFERAATLFASQDLIAAKRLLDILWSNSAYRSYFPLKDLITELYNLLGQRVPGT